MTANRAGVDPTALEDLKVAAQTFSFFQECGEPVEFWEIVRLAKSNRSLLQYQLNMPERNRSTLGPILEELQPIRQQLSSTVVNLRKFIENAPGRPKSPEMLELALSFLLASTKEQKNISRWLADPEKNLRKAGGKLSAIASIANPYREALLPWRLTVDQPKPVAEQAAGLFHLEGTGWDDPGEIEDPFDSTELEPLVPLKAVPDEAASSAPDAPAEASPPEPDIDIDASVLEDLRTAFKSRSIFQETVQACEFWELVLLAMKERATTRATLEEMDRAKKENKPAKFHEGARNLFTRVLSIRSKDAIWVRPLRDFLLRLPLGAIPNDTMELALALLVASSIGRKESKKWLDEPGRHLDEALNRLKYLVAQAGAYQKALWRS